MSKLNNKIEKFCKVCNKIFYVFPSRIKNGKSKYCSNKCYFTGRIYKTNNSESFWNNINIIYEDTCWEWKKCKKSGGYGVFHYKGKNILSHRLAYFLAFPEQNTEENRKLCVLHMCDNPPCCNPSHLKLGTHNDNVQDKVNKNRQLKGEKIGSSKLTEEQVKEILLLKNKFSEKIVAEIYKVNYMTIKDIFNNKTWKYIERNNL